MLVGGLPPGSAFRDHWPAEAELAATLVEQFGQWAQTFLAFQAGKKVRPPGSLRVPRPGDPPEKKQVETNFDAILAFARQQHIA